MLLERPIASQLFAALTTARGHEPASRAIASVREAYFASSHTLRGALDRVQRDPIAVQAFVWPTLATVRETLNSLDQSIDRALIAAVSNSPLDALAKELAASSNDEPRAFRSIEIVWKHLSPPASRANASLIDLLRAYPLGDARAFVYLFLASRAVDVRGPLADDLFLRAPERMRVLSMLAARRADARRSQSLAWEPNARATLARTLADWTLYATHPRQLLYWFRKRARLVSRTEYDQALYEIAAWPLAPEVRSHLDVQRRRERESMTARNLGSGRYECAQCGTPRVSAIGKSFVDPKDPTCGVEIEFACNECGAQYFTAWEISRVTEVLTASPSGWSDIE